MTFLFGRQKSMANTVTAASGLALQSSVQGQVIPVIYGTTRVAANLIWTGDFVSTPQYSSGGAGGKGGVTGGGGGKGGQPSGYVYSTAVAMALSEGPINGVGNVYVNKNVTSLSSLGLSFFTGTLGQAPWSYLVTKHSNAQNELHTIPSVGPYTITVLFPWESDLGVVKGVTTAAFTKVNGAPSSGQYSIARDAGGLGCTYTFNSADAGTSIVIAYIGPYQALYSLSTGIPTSAPYTIDVQGMLQVANDRGVTGVATPFTPVGSAPSANQYSVSAGVYTFNSANASQVVTITYSSTGGQNIGYSLTSYVASGSYQLGSSAQLPNHNFEVEGVYSNSVAQEVIGEQYTIPGSPYQITVEFAADFSADAGVVDDSGNVYTKVGSSPGFQQYTASSGVYTFNSQNSGTVINISYAATAGPDADPSLVIADILSNTHYGAGFPSGRVGSLTAYQDYSIATGLLISPAYTTQTQTSSVITDIATATNSAPVWSNGALTLIPYGDTSITANGVTYNPNLTPLYSLTDDDFMENSHATGSSSSDNKDPVLLTRTRPSDHYNSIKLEWLNRANQYNPAIIEAKDQALINLYGLRQDASRTFHMFCNGNAARLSVQLQLQRQYVRNLYQFQVDQRYIVLDPMDVIEISDSYLGLSNQLVRILEITENDDYSLTMTAEEIIGGIGSAPAYSYQTPNGFTANYNQSPGNANTPVIFEPPVQITQTGLEVWLAASGGAQWGGCDVWASSDNVTYRFLGRISGPARMGSLTADFPSGTDPDTTDTLSVDLSESFGTLSPATTADADANHTLCYVGGELVSFSSASLTSQYNYNLSTYLRRGQYGTMISDHPSSTKFARLDNGIFTIPYDKSRIGQTLYIKLLSFNLYGGGEQLLSDVEPTAYTIQGPPLPGQVQNFSAQQQGNVVACYWTDLETDSGLKGYDIAYAPQGTADWTAFVLLTEAHRGTEMTNASVPPGTWTIAIRAHDIADNLGPMSTVDITVTNMNEVIASQVAEPDWNGSSIVDAVVHPSGVLVPTGIHTCDQYTQCTVSGFSLATASLVGAPAATYYVKVTAVCLYGETTPAAEQSIVCAADQVPTVNGFTSSGGFGLQGYNVYLATSSGAETLQNSTPIDPGVNTWTMPGTAPISGASPPTFNTTGWDDFDIFVPDPFPVNGFNTEYFGNVIDTGFVDNVRVWISYKAVPGPGQTGTPAGIQTFLESSNNNITYTGQAWTIGYITLRYLYAYLFYNNLQLTAALQHNPGNLCYFADFTVTVDNPNFTENGNNVVIAPGGTTITFPTQFHSDPFVQATVIGSSALYATVSSVTQTTCLINVWDNTGTSVGGTVNWSASGQ